MFARRFNRFMRSSKFNQRRNFKKDNEKKEKGYKESRFYECKKTGHIRIKCPLVKKNEWKRKKRALAAWSKNEFSLGDKDQDEGVANLFLVAKLKEVSSLNPSKFTLEELLDAFNEVMNEFEEVSFKYNVLKKKSKSLDNKVRILQ